MQLHTLQQKSRRRFGQRIGRGGKRGTTSGRGTKGQKARAGAKIRPAIRDIIKKIPKRRGYRFRTFREKPIVLDLSLVAAKFQTGERVTPASLMEKGLVRARKPFAVKILGSRPIQKKLTFSGILFSHAASRMVYDAGGSLE